MTSPLCLDSKVCLGFLSVIYRFVFAFPLFHSTYQQLVNLEAFALEKDENEEAENAVVLAGYICI